MFLKRMILKSVVIAITLPLLLPAAYASHTETETTSHEITSPGKRWTIHEDTADALYDYGDQVIDLVIEEELATANIPFAKRELFTLVLKAAMRRDVNKYPKEYLQEDLLFTLLKQELKNRFSPYGDHLEFAQTLFAIQNVFLKIQLSMIGRQIMRLNPFVWQTPEQLAANDSLIRSTQQQLRALNQSVRMITPDKSMAWTGNRPHNHLFTEGSAYRQLLDVSRNGWDNVLNGQSGNTDNYIRNWNEPDSKSDADDDFNDIDGKLSNAVNSSDEAMEQFNQDVAENGTKKMLEASAEKNVQFGEQAKELERQTVNSNIKSLAIGVMMGAAGTAFGMWMQSSPAFRTNLGYSYSSPTRSVGSSAVRSGASRTFSAPRIGGSWDGAVGQTLFTR